MDKKIEVSLIAVLLNTLNRLSVVGGNNIVYAVNGNITQLPGTGMMTYDNSAKPYQVTMLTPTGTAVPIRNQNVTYTSFQRPAQITEGTRVAEFKYRANGDRVYTHFSDTSNNYYSEHYLLNNEYEMWDGNDASAKEILYLGGDAYSAPAVLVIPELDNPWEIYYICRDYLGSITHIANADGTLKAEYSYDAWGRLRNPVTQVAYAPGSEPVLFLGRGYTGHEHLPWFGLINMNARLYDPALGRFLSPDPYVQAPDFSQSFNRYSYCLNNPLRYVDKNGEFWNLIIGGLIGGIVNWATHGCQFSWKGLGYFGVGALAGALSAGIGTGISSAMAGGSFSAGFMGTAAAKVAATSFLSGAAMGGGAGATGGLISGMGNGLLGGQNFGQSVVSGLKDGLIGGLTGGVLGGLAGGIDAVLDGRRFFDGATVKNEIFADVNVVGVAQKGRNNCLPASGESINKSLGGSTTQETLRNSAGGNPDTDPLNVGKFWKETFANETKLKVDVGSIYDVVPTLKDGGRIAAILSKTIDGVGHSVVVKETFLQTVIKVSGRATSTVMYRIMDPATGGFRNVSIKDIMWTVFKVVK